MPTQRKYIEFFDIDKEFYKCVDEKIFNASPTLWKKFYPHDKFQKMLSDVTSVLSGGRTGKESVWVEGAYGTGKSYAILTLKKLLDASADEVTEYFNTYKLPQNLLAKLLSIKNNCNVLSVFRDGSANILSDRDLIVAIQESIRNAMKDKGLVGGEEALKEKGIEWLSDNVNSKHFQNIIDNDDRYRLTGKDVASIVSELRNSTDRDYVIKLIRIIDEVGRERNINIFQPDIDSLLKWIKGVIKDNTLSAIVFIWDEFTEFFKNNRNRLTDFQAIVNLSNVTPFYLIPVTHVSGGLFSGADDDKKKILNRFIEPTSRIELPDGIAFELIGTALKHNTDPIIEKEWGRVSQSINDETHDARKRVAERVGIDESKLREILPLHPYSALVLKYLAEKFQSNQRSMFDFIKADNGDNIKAFQWFIKNHGPYDADSQKLLTIDWLWDFFYEKGKNELSPEIRGILDAYNRQNARSLSEAEKRVFKTILMFIATSRSVNDAEELLRPNSDNVRLAFTGTEISGVSAITIANNLVRDKIIYERSIVGGKTVFSVATEQVNEIEIEQTIEKLKKDKLTSDLVDEAGLAEVFALKPAFRGRFEVRVATVNDIRQKVGRLNNETQTGQHKHKIPVLLCFARDDKESDALFKLIEEESKKLVPTGCAPICFIDMSHSQLSNDSWVRYLDAKARQEVLRQRNPQESEEHGRTAKGILETWKNSLITSDFSIWYIPAQKSNLRAANLVDLQDQLKEVDRTEYPLALELHYDVIDNMFNSSPLKQGAGFGIKQEVGGTYKNLSKPLEKALRGAWNIPNYWKVSPGLLISKLKIFVDEYFTQSLDVNTEVDLTDLYSKLQAKPYGLMNCNLTAFILGFLLKEYVQNEGEYYFSDRNIDDVLTQDKLRDLIESVIKDSMSPPNRPTEKIIKAKSQEEAKFAEGTATIFKINVSSCFVGKVREMLRSEMKSFGFPIFYLREIINNNSFSVSNDIIKELINKYVGVANTDNYGDGQAKETQLVKEIGGVFIKTPSVVDELSQFVIRDNCLLGMKKYIAAYRNGELKTLSERLGIGEKYVDSLQEKFSKVDSANWAWNQKTADERIDEVIIEYKIIQSSRTFGVNASTFSDLLNAWIEKLKLCRISYDAVKNNGIQENELFEMLVILRKNGTISNAGRFLELLQLHQQELLAFLSSGTVLFKSIAQALLVELLEEQKDEVFHRLPSDTFAVDKQTYWAEVEKTVNAYIKNLGRQKLRAAWKSKTNTETPYEWSSQYKVPIIALAPDEEVTTASKYFGTINHPNPDSKMADEALKYIDSILWWNDLSSEEKRDTAFVKGVSKEYSALIGINEAKDYLLRTVTDEPYHWWSNDTVRAKLRELAMLRYNATGADRALKIIDNLGNPDKVKEYLTRLIKENITIGLEIIRENEE